MDFAANICTFVDLEANILWSVLSRYTLSDFEANTHRLILKQYFGEGQNLWRAENLITQLHRVGKFNVAIFRFYGRSRLASIKCLRAKVGDQIRGHAMMFCKFATNSCCLLWWIFLDALESLAPTPVGKYLRILKIYCLVDFARNEVPRLNKNITPWVLLKKNFEYVQDAGRGGPQTPILHIFKLFLKQDS